MSPLKSAIVSSLLLGCSGLVAATNFVPADLDLLYPKNATYAAGFQLIYILAWNDTVFGNLHPKVTLSTSLLDLGQNPQKTLSTSSKSTNTDWKDVSELSHAPLGPGQYSLQYTLSIPRCSNATETNFFNKTDSVVFTISNQSGALHPNGSDFFVGNHPCRGISIPIDADGQTGACSIVDASNAGPIAHDRCPYSYTPADFQGDFESLGFDPNIPFASQTATTMMSSTSSGLGMMATPFSGVVAAGAGLVGLGAALL
jgi:hypothetical protein